MLPTRTIGQKYKLELTSLSCLSLLNPCIKTSVALGIYPSHTPCPWLGTISIT